MPPEVGSISFILLAMLWILLSFNGSVQAFASSNGLFGLSTSYRVIQKPNYTLNLGFSSLNYRGTSYNFATFDMGVKFKNFSIRIYGNMPINTSFNSRTPFNIVR